MVVGVVFDLDGEDFTVDDVGGLVNDLLNLLTSIVFEGNYDLNVDEPSSVDVSSLQQPGLDSKHVEVPQCL